MYACLQCGLSFKTSQGSFIPLSPPLTITQQELDQALDILESALTAVEESR
jgi:4-aminobutyrate aminotransferase